jgi:hypothetical protein
VLHALLDIGSMDHLLGHPGYGASWEGFAMENILQSLTGWRAGFFRTSAGAEIDLIMTKAGKPLPANSKHPPRPWSKKAFSRRLPI